MSLPDVVISIWVKPHRSWGYFAEIDVEDVDDGLPGGVFQSFADVKTFQRWPEFLPEFPYRDFNVSREEARLLVQLIDRITYSFVEHPFTPMLGGAFYGLRVARGYQDVSVVWQGKYEDQDEPIRNLYAVVRRLAEVGAKIQT